MSAAFPTPPTREQRRWLRNDAHLWLRPDHARFEKPQRSERKYSPDQPRVPAGRTGGGQWTSGFRQGNTGVLFPFDAAVSEDLSDVDLEAQDNGMGLDNFDSDVDRVGYEEQETDFSNARRRSGPIFINGRWFEATPAQAARFEAANARAQEAIARVREPDPSWRPVPSAYGVGIESEINRSNNLAVEAQSRITDLSRLGIGPGPFAGESIPARGPERNFTAWERNEINRIGAETGCHTCGTRDPGTTYGNFVFDHQPPNALNQTGQQGRGFPHCVSCSLRQGGFVKSLKGKR